MKIKISFSEKETKRKNFIMGLIAPIIPYSRVKHSELKNGYKCVYISVREWEK